MTCKNCNEQLENDAHFCDNCGAKVMKQRITLRFLLGELFASMGFESLYFTTLKKMLVAPHEVINEYLNGVRKRYVNPFAFLAVGAALSLISFNSFADEFKAMQGSIETEQSREMKEIASKDLSKIKNISEKDLKRLKDKQLSAKIGLKVQEKYLDLMLRYFNLVTFLFLPFYALLSKWTYRKPHNYGEHIVMNAYLQGTTMYISVIAFFSSLVLNPNIYFMSMFLYILYYLYAFKKLYKHSIGKSILKLIRFIIVLAVCFILLIVVILILLVIVGIVLKFTNPALLEKLITPQ